METQNIVETVHPFLPESKLQWSKTARAKINPIHWLHYICAECNNNGLLPDILKNSLSH